MIICNTCRAELLDGSIFCDSCGARIDARIGSVASQIAPAPLANRPEQPAVKAAPGAYASQMASNSGVMNGSSTGLSGALEDEETANLGALQVVILSTGRELSFPWNEKRSLLVGRRDPGQGIYPDIDVTEDGGIESGVSRTHARVIMGLQSALPGSPAIPLLQVEDIGSSNGTFIARQQIPAHRPIMIRNGEEVRFGRLTIRFAWPNDTIV